MLKIKKSSIFFNTVFETASAGSDILALLLLIFSIYFNVRLDMVFAVQMFVIGIFIIRNSYKSITFSRSIMILGFLSMIVSMVIFINYYVTTYFGMEYWLPVLSLLYIPNIIIIITFIIYIFIYSNYGYKKYIIIDLAFVISLILLLNYYFLFGSVMKIETYGHVYLKYLLAIMNIINISFIYIVAVYKIRYMAKYIVDVTFVVSLFFYMVTLIFYVNFYNYTSNNGFALYYFFMTFLLSMINRSSSYAKTLSTVEYSDDIDVSHMVNYLEEPYMEIVHIVFLVIFFVLFIMRYIRLNEFLILGSVSIIYQVTSKQINYLIISKYIMRKEENQNKDIENRISIRNRELMEINHELKFYSMHDRLTKLPNREQYIQDLDILIRNRRKIKTILLSISNYREIRSLYGLKFSDEVIKAFLGRLESFTYNHSIYKISAYEFAIISENEDSDYYQKAYDSLRYLADLDFRVKGVKIPLKIRFGFLDKDCIFQDSTDVLKELDINSFKYRNGTTFERQYEEYKNELIINKEKKEIASLLKEADFDSEFMVYYQPQFDIQNKELVGAEALLRWKKDDKFISPALFIPISEFTGDINRISAWVCRTVLDTMLTWSENLPKDFRVGINISPVILKNDDFLNNFIEYTTRTGKFNYSTLDFELTEQTDLQKDSDIILRLNKIKNMNIHLSVDDFGTGYSSLQNISVIDINRLKIPREIVSSIEKSEFSRSLVKSIVNMCKSSNIATIAEGVETEEQLMVLREIGCQQVQGYIWGKPMPKAVFEETFSII